MEKSEQIRIINEFCDSVRDSTIQAIKSGKVPDYWDGHEIREYIAYLTRCERTQLMRRERSRMRRFMNDLRVRNL